MAQTGAEKVKKHHKKMIDLGFKRVCVYIPANRVAELRALAITMRGPKPK